jgi:hypothetical protein
MRSQRARERERKNRRYTHTEHKRDGNFNYIECVFIMFLLGYPVVNDPLYNHEVFGPSKGKGGDIGGKSDEQLVKDLINIHNAENWLGIDGDSELSMFNTKSMGSDLDDSLVGVASKGKHRQSHHHVHTQLSRMLVHFSI